MPFEKGRPKTGGRVKGTKNKRTQAIDNFMEKVMSSIENQIEQNPTIIVDELKLKEMLEFYRDFMQYYKPKVATLKVEEKSKQTINIRINNAK